MRKSSGDSRGHALANDRFASLVREGEVHSALYTSPEIFEAEIENIFHRSWIYVGHESEVANVGDFQRRQIGRQPIIMVRSHDGSIRVLMNRCRHRGALVCEMASGNAQHFRCWYHGWTYDTAGNLLNVVGPGAYGEAFRKEDHGLTPAPRVDSYRGFVFASLSPDGESLREQLGLAMPMIDIMVDASPIGEIVADAGAHKTVYRGNWKLVGMDGYHVHFTHATVVEARRRAAAGPPVEGTVSRDPWNDSSPSRTRDLGHGHAMLDLLDHRLQFLDEHLEEVQKTPGGEDYIRAMIDAHGAERAHMIIASDGDPHLGIFPNMQLIGSHIRLINPIKADETEIIMFPTRLKGVSDALNQVRLRQHEWFYGPAGAGSPDDAEIFERVQNGLQAAVEPWIDISRGLNRQQVQPDGSIVGKISDEVTQRAMMRRWVELMAGAA